MKNQSYKNHWSYYGPHHFVFYPLIFLFIGVSIWCSVNYPDRSLEFGAIAVIFFMIAWLSFMMRQHYALGNQNRIIRLELRLRYFQLNSKSFEPLEQQLTFAQLAALRFAPDEQFNSLIQQAIDESLSPGAIKRSIQNWIPDYMRI